MCTCCSVFFCVIKFSLWSLCAYFFVYHDGLLQLHIYIHEKRQAKPNPYSPHLDQFSWWLNIILDERFCVVAAAAAVCVV